jgi:hypothetical protein
MLGALTLRNTSRPLRLGLALLLSGAALVSTLFLDLEQTVNFGSAGVFNTQIALKADNSSMWIALALASIAVSSILLGLMQDQMGGLLVQVALAIVAVLAANAITLVFVMVLMDVVGLQSRKQDMTKISSGLSLRWFGVLWLLGSEVELRVSNPATLILIGLAIRQIGVWVSSSKSEAILSTAVHLMLLARVRSENGLILLLAALGALIGALYFGPMGEKLPETRNFALAIAGLGAVPALAGSSESAMLAAILAIVAFPILLGSRLFASHHRVYRFLYAGLFLLALQYGYSVMLPDRIVLFLVGLLSAGSCLYGIYLSSLQEVESWPQPETARRLAYEAGLTLPVLAGIVAFAQGSAEFSIYGIVWIVGALVMAVGFHRVRDWLLPIRIEVPALGNLFYVASRGSLAMVRSMGSILEGRGAFLWMILLILLVFLMGR